MRPSFTLATYAFLATVVIMPGSGGGLGFASSGVFAFLLLHAINHVFEHGWNQPPETTRSKPPVSWGIALCWVLYPLMLAVAVGSAIWNETWGPAPVLVVCLGAYALSFVLRVRENRAIASLPCPLAAQPHRGRPDEILLRTAPGGCPEHDAR